MASSTVDVIQPTTTTRATSFLSLPYDIRLHVYNLIILGDWYGPPDEFTVYEEFVMQDHWIWDKFQFLHICKQIYDETSPILFRKWHIDNSLYSWIKFLRVIGPRNISHIRELLFSFECRGNCHHRGVASEEWIEYRRRVTEILEIFREARLDLNLKRLVVYMTKCSGYTPISDGYISEEYARSCGIVVQPCQAYKDLTFLKSISEFRNTAEIEIYDHFDPLWGMILHQKLGFILKRQAMSITLVNPNHPNHAVDLRGYEPSKVLKGVYDKNWESPHWYDDHKWLVPVDVSGEFKVSYESEEPYEL
ncbi:hypothetical protein F4677DRAFT_448559 [Hypoxylon crocopeplum]|nr:hypothetical protein F4677DRAFT_448559 [Hypoxylon crocopeplum]